MQCGTPSITTSIGAESMFGDLPWNGFITDNPEDFAAKAVSLYQDKTLWNTSQNNGIQIIEKRYLKSIFITDFLKNILTLQNNLKQHRLNNFIGALLHHQTLQSTKYMSKWIEAKNKS
jgi:glycosyltransferase involved in cell wall biosynthesis